MVNEVIICCLHLKVWYNGRQRHKLNHFHEEGKLLQTLLDRGTCGFREVGFEYNYPKA